MSNTHGKRTKRSVARLLQAKWRPEPSGRVVVDEEPEVSYVVSGTEGVPDKKFTMPCDCVCLTTAPEVAVHVCEAHNRWLEGLEGGAG